MHFSSGAYGNKFLNFAVSCLEKHTVWVNGNQKHGFKCCYIKASTKSRIKLSLIMIKFTAKDLWLIFLCTLDICMSIWRRLLFMIANTLIVHCGHNFVITVLIGDANHVASYSMGVQRIFSEQFLEASERHSKFSG